MAASSDSAAAQRFARNVFYAASVYGLVSLPPQYFMERSIGVDRPPAITHPEYFYGFLGVACAWQLAFAAIARSPQRLRPLIPAAIVEKISFAVPVFYLYAQGRVDLILVPFACIDLLLGTLFGISYLRLADSEGDARKNA